MPSDPLFQQIVETVGIGFVVLDRHFTVHHWNRWMALNSQIPSEQILGRSLFELFPKLDAPMFRRTCGTVFNFGHPMFLSQKLHNHLFPMSTAVKTDCAFDLMQQSCSVFPLRDPAGAISHLCITVNDVTEIAEYEQRLGAEVRQRRENEALLRLRNQELDAYAHTVAHDLKTPLTTLIGMSRILTSSDEKVSEPMRVRAAAMIYETSLKMNQIVEALLSLSQDRLKQPIRMVPTAPGAIALEASQRLQEPIGSLGAALSIDPALPAVMAHAPWLEEVFANLLSNALKYGGRPPRLEVGGQRSGPEVRLWVRDHGPGVPPDGEAHLFTEFSRLEASDEEGHGLGLSIVKRLVEAMGGRVGYESPAEGGARFWFDLPAPGA